MRSPDVTFVPRRVLYELRAGRDYFEQKERCVFCDIISQEVRQNQRVVEVQGGMSEYPSGGVTQRR